MFRPKAKSLQNATATVFSQLASSTVSVSTNSTNLMSFNEHHQSKKTCLPPMASSTHTKKLKHRDRRDACATASVMKSLSDKTKKEELIAQPEQSANITLIHGESVILIVDSAGSKPDCNRLNQRPTLHLDRSYSMILFHQHSEEKIITAMKKNDEVLRWVDTPVI